MPITKLRPSFTFDDDRLAALRALVPEAFADGRINWDALHEALGDHLEDETPDAEHFGLFWPGKRQARRLAARPFEGTLIPCPVQGVDEATTRNLFIEGENLEVLKLLRKAYAGKVKLICIDPPYNTGSDLIYPDDFSEPLEAHLRRTGQADEEGQPLTTNTRASGRFHSNWLSMIYPRLLVAQSLLSEDGVILINIDDTEVNHLVSILREVFGEENWLGVFVWQSKKGGGSDTAGLVSDHEYVVCFAKRKGPESLGRVLLEAEELTQTDARGPYRLGRELNKWGASSRREDRPTMYFPIPGPNGEDVYPIRNDGTAGRWRWGKKKMHDIASRGDVEYVPRGDGTYIVYEKIRSTDPRTKPFRTWLTDVGTTADGSKLVKELFGGLKVYDFPKPLALIRHLIMVGTRGDDDIVLDFFAGSCTTAHAVMQQNREDEGTRRFICVQMAERTPEKSEARKAGYKTISALGAERIRRAINEMSATTDGQQLPLEPHDTQEDLGFRCYRLDRSHFRRWRDYEGDSPAEVQTLFDQFETPLVDGWKPEDLLVELMLLEGFPLDSTVTPQTTFAHNTIHLVESDWCDHRLFVCLDASIHDDTVAHLSLAGQDVFVCLDSALTDQAKLRLADQCNLKVI